MLVFHERMTGWISFDESSYNQAMVHGRQSANACVQELRIEIDDVELFLADPRHSARASGVVRCDQLGGELHVERGALEVLVADGARRRKRMIYRLFLRDGEDRPLTLSGFKAIEDDPNLDVWDDTTRLFVRVLSGHLETEPEGDELTVATGILHLTHAGLLRMLSSFRPSGGLRGLGEMARFERFFVAQLAEAYVGPPLTVNSADWPSPDHLDVRWQGHPPGTWHDLPGRPGLRRRIIGFRAGDGRPLTLHHIRGEHEPHRGPVLLAHGCSVRANLFYAAPTAATLVDWLVAAGYDVWAENWRGSIDLPASDWTLEQAAVHDHPAAVAEIRRQTGATTLKAIVHCQGSTSFAMAAVAGLVPEVRTIVSNAVSLHVSLPPPSQLKLRALIPLLAPLLRGIDPQWAARPPSVISALAARWGTSVRRGCDSEECRLANYAYGVGADVLWRHALLDGDTHAWIAREFGFCPMSFFRQMGRCARAGHLVAGERLAGLPASFVDGRPQTDARFVFLAGDRNRCFLPASQRRTFAYFEDLHPGRHALSLLPGYTHLDVFFGREAHRDVYPLIVEALGPEA